MKEASEEDLKVAFKEREHGYIEGTTRTQTHTAALHWSFLRNRQQLLNPGREKGFVQPTGHGCGAKATSEKLCSLWSTQALTKATLPYQRARGGVQAPALPRHAQAHCLLPAV